MSTLPGLSGINEWMHANGIYLVDYSPEEQKVFLAIVGDNRSDKEVTDLAKEVKVILTTSRLVIGRSTTPFKVMYKVISSNQISEARQRTIASYIRIQKQIEEGEVGYEPR